MVIRNPFTNELEVDKMERLTFGKHSGKLIATVMVTDPKYLVHMVETADRLPISDTWQEYIREWAEKNLYQQFAGSYNTAYYRNNVRGRHL